VGEPGGVTPKVDHPELAQVPGERIDPPAKDKPDAVRRIEGRGTGFAVAFAVKDRVKATQATLLAGGTAYYAFLAMFSVLAFAYGVTALISADRVSEWLTTGLEEALPGLVGDNGIDPATLERVGRSSSVIGLLVLLYAGGAVMSAASDSLHRIYGAEPDGRNPAKAKIRLFAWLAILGPLVLLSYTLSAAVGGFSSELLDDIGLDGSLARGAAIVGATLLTLALDVGIMFLLLSRLGGIRPPTRALLWGSVLGAIVIGALKALMGTIVAWSVDKPQYGSFAVPISILVVLWFQSLTLYAAAATTAATATVGRHVERTRDI
jgi:membrane protein